MNKQLVKPACLLGAIVVALSFAQAGQADLLDPAVYDALSPLQQASAQGNQAAYDALQSAGCGEPVTGFAPPQPMRATRKPVPRGKFQAPQPGVCDGGHYNVFTIVAPLVDTANILSDSGPFIYADFPANAGSVGRALQWTAIEEYSAIGEMAFRFARLQQERVLRHLVALRYGQSSTGSPGRAVAMNASHARGGGASADPNGLVSPWGVFADASFGYGHRGDTSNNGGFEDAYRFSDDALSVGTDYRFSDTLVAGFMLGHSNGRTNFDGAVSVVNAQLGANGYSGFGFFLYEPSDFFVSGSMGWQWLEHTTTRHVQLTSNNPNVPNVNAVASGRTRSRTFTVVLDTGYDLRRGATTLEPTVRLQFQHFDIGAFSESSSGTDAPSLGILQTVDKQRFEPIDTVAGLKLQHAITPAFGVFVPFARAEFHHLLNNGTRTITSEYSGIVDLVGLGSDAAFHTPSDKPDNTYLLVNGGASAVFPHGIQAYLQYQQIFGLKPFTDHTITGGARWEF